MDTHTLIILHSLRVSYPSRSGWREDDSLRPIYVSVGNSVIFGCKACCIPCYIFQSVLLIRYVYCRDEMGFVHPSQLESLHAVENFTPDNERPFFTKTRKKANRQDELDDANEQAEDCSQRSEGQEYEADPPETTANQNYTKGPDGKRIEFVYEKSAFWCANHKLAIAVPALAPLLLVAKKEFIKNRKEYSIWTDESRGSGLSLSFNGPNFVSSCFDNEHVNGNGNGNSSAKTDGDKKAILEKNLLQYTRVLVIVNCDYASAWNTRLVPFPFSI